ncbi:MAG: o-succinylbenzoate synthase [Acidobacteriota bacterium]|nr:o-succinylbenzoate synthase [Acidobacteriota bacterium]
MVNFSERELTLSRLEILIVDVPQIESFQSAVGKRHSRQALLLRWYDADGRWGIGECSCRPDPYFSHEYLDGVATVIGDFLFENLKDCRTYGDLTAQLARIRGWGFARAVVLDAVHDLWRRNGQTDPLDAWERPRLEKIPVGISLGLYSSTEALLDKVGRSVEEGYHRIKLKIKPGLPQDYLAAVRRAFPDLYLGCDANGSFDEDSIEQLVAMQDLGLANLEQPFSPDRLDLCAALKKRAPGLVICLDEGVSEPGHLIAALHMGALDELNIKPGRVGGIPVAIEMAEICEAHAVPVWIGGMFETSIGRSSNLRLAACFPDARAHDLSPSKRYFQEDLVTRPVSMDDRGFVARPDAPVTVDEDALTRFLQKQIIKRI